MLGSKLGVDGLCGSKSTREFRGRNVFMWILLVALLFNGGLIPWFLVIRNLGWSGDTVSKRPRTSNAPSLEDILSLCQADSIYCFFGYNE